MTTRSGTSYKDMTEQQTHAEGTSTEGLTTLGTTLPELTSLTDMVRVMIEDRERREREIALERERREKEIAEERERQEQQRAEERHRYTQESEKRMQEMHKQMERLQQFVVEQSTAVKERARNDIEPVRLTRLAENDDIEAYLTTFERIMVAHEVKKEHWSFKLAPQLTGKAQQAYAALAPEDVGSYDAVKTAILRRYNINEETYRQRFRKMRPKELLTRLKDLATRWTKECTSQEELLDVMLKEQFLMILPEAVRISVIEQNPKNSEEASKFAHSYIQACSTSIAHKGSGSGSKTSAPTTKCPRCDKYGHWARDCPKPRYPDGQTTGTRTTTTEESGQRRNQPPTGPGSNRPPFDVRTVRCYNCNERGHYSSSCPKRSLYCEQARDGVPGHDRAHRHGIVNGVYCPDILIDTGATQTLVHSKLVTDEDILDDEVTIKCAHGDTVAYPLAAVKINIAGKNIVTTAAVSKTLPASVLLGWDIPEFLTYVTEITPQERPEEEALAVVTRRQRKELQNQTEQEEARSQATPTQIELAPVVPAPETTDNDLAEMDDSLFLSHTP